MRNTLILAGLLTFLVGSALIPASFAAKEMTQGEKAEAIRTSPPSATLDVEAKQLRLLVGGGAGKGVLHFKGKDYPFTLKGATAGGVGYTEVSATGKVHFLEKLEDFPGKYSALTAGAALVEGAGVSQFENSKGVVLTVSSKTKGAALNLGVGAINIELAKR